MRNSVIAAMLDLEEHIKEAAANVIAKSFGVNQNDYLLYKNYQNKRKYKSCFTLSGVLKTLTNTLETDKEPIHHYQTKYGIVPPWILLKSVYFRIFLFSLENSEMRRGALANGGFKSNDSKRVFKSH